MTQDGIAAMFHGMTYKTNLRVAGALTIVLIATCHQAAFAQVVPGTGTLLNSDDFEDESWNFTFNLPKSSKEEDEQIRYPLGGSQNGMWMESPKRGVPDTVQR